MRNLIVFTSFAMATVSANAGTPAANALPQAPQLVAGQATVVQSGSRMDINQSSAKVIINWNAFNIGSAAQVNFNQPSSSSVALNRVVGIDQSAIFGKLNANGQVFLINPNGVIFGRGAQVDVGGLVASTMRITDSDFLSGNYRFTRDGSIGSVLNEGSLYGKYIALLAPEVINDGLIVANLGTVALAAGEKTTLSIAGQQLLAVEVDKATLDMLVENRKAIVANEGMVILSAQAVNKLMGRVINSGTVEANGITANGGTIRLEASHNIQQTGTLAANGAAQGNGGNITVIADLKNESSLTQADGSISAMGGPLSGNGGFVETSASQLKIADGFLVNTKAPAGRAGVWLLDPGDITIAPTGGTMSGATLALNLGSGDVTLDTLFLNAARQPGDIFVNDNINVTGATSANTLTLKAVRNITVGAGKSITDEVGNSLSVNLQAGGAVVFLDNTSATSHVDAINIHGDLNIGGRNCAPGSTCFATGNSEYAMGIYVGRYVSLNTNGGDINLAGKGFTTTGAGGLGSYANQPLGLAIASYGKLSGSNVRLYGESSNANGIQVNYGENCLTPATCASDTQINAANQITATGKGVSGDTVGIEIKGSTWTAPSTILTGIGSGSAASISLDGSQTFNGNVDFVAQGATGNIVLGSQAKVIGSATSNITLAANGSFINNAGPNALSVSGGGRWLVYSNDVTGNTYLDLSSDNFALWGRTYGGAVPETGNRYLFSTQPTVTLSVENKVKNFGDVIDLSAPVLNIDYSTTALVNAATYGNVFKQDVFSTAPILSSFGASATTAEGVYAIRANQTAPAGYSLTTLAGTLTVNPKLVAPTLTPAPAPAPASTPTPTPLLSTNATPTPAVNTVSPYANERFATRISIAEPTAVATINSVPSGGVEAVISEPITSADVKSSDGPESSPTIQPNTSGVNLNPDSRLSSVPTNVPAAPVETASLAVRSESDRVFPIKLPKPNKTGDSAKKSNSREKLASCASQGKATGKTANECVNIEINESINSTATIAHGDPLQNSFDEMPWLNNANPKYSKSQNTYSSSLESVNLMNMLLLFILP